MSLLAIGGFASSGYSQDDVAAIPKFDFVAAAAEYEILSGTDRLVCEPFQAELLRWSNPVRSTPAGTVFLWHHKGVPQAACCMFAYRNPDEMGKYLVSHEFVSLSTDLIEAKSDGATAWQTTKPGIAWRDVSDGPPVPQSRAGRLAQMRNIASGFTGTVGKKQEELRMLRQPIYRYPETMERDGAIFAFAQATDPEILLLLECDPKQSDAAWRFAVARMTRIAFALRRGDKEVHSEPWSNPATDESHIYQTLQRVPWKAVEDK